MVNMQISRHAWAAQAESVSHLSDVPSTEASHSTVLARGGFCQPMGCLFQARCCQLHYCVLHRETVSTPCLSYCGNDCRSVKSFCWTMDRCTGRLGRIKCLTKPCMTPPDAAFLQSHFNGRLLHVFAVDSLMDQASKHMRLQSKEKLH